MSKKKIFICVLGFIVILMDLVIIKFLNSPNENTIQLVTEVQSKTSGVYQIYYSNDGTFSEEKSLQNDYIEINKNKSLTYLLPLDTTYIRFDFPDAVSEVQLSNMKFQYKNVQKQIDKKLLENLYNKNSIKELKLDDKSCSIKTDASDPHFVIDISSMKLQEFINRVNEKSIITHKILYCCVLTLLYILTIFNYKKIISIIKDVYESRKLIGKLAKNDFKTKYVGSYLGIVWAFIQPIITILVYWFVFEVGFRTQKVENVSYVLWLTTGLIPWFYFSEAWLGGTNSLLEYSYLVKKVVFNINVLPIVKIVSALFVHIFFIGFTIILFMINGNFPDLYDIQILYYVICMIALILGISYISSAVIIFFRDLSQIIGIFLQIGMWATPILWSYTMLDAKYSWLLKINPMYYIVSGYRDSLINKSWFWQSMDWTIYYWGLIILLFILGSIIFKRLKPHFADVL